MRVSQFGETTQEEYSKHAPQALARCHYLRITSLTNTGSPPPLIPPQAGDTGRLQIVLKENILLFTQIP